MAFKLNPFTSEFDYYKAPAFRGVLAVAPSSPQEGWFYINSTDDGYYVYYGGQWQLLHTLTPATLSFLLLEDGFNLLLEDGFKLALQ